MESPPAFKRFVAIDWSGAAGPRYAGIAVAECRADGGPPRLVPPPGGGLWTRQGVHDWLLAGLGGAGLGGAGMVGAGMVGAEPALVGIDCAFSLPFAVAGGYFADGAGDAPALWALVEATCAGRDDFLGHPFAATPAFAAGYWRRGPRPPGYREAHRATELACRAEGLGAPESPYKLIGAKQVGLGGLAGMRLLHALLRAAPERLAVWPFAPPEPGRTVLVEIYPRLFLRRAGAGNGKLRDGAALDRALAVLGCPPAGLDGPLGDHATDALVSAAGLRLLAADPSVWTPPALDETARRQEGWIFGCGLAQGAGPVSPTWRAARPRGP